MSEEDKLEMISFLWIFRGWLLDCTAHGLPRIISEPQFKRKVFWFIIVVVFIIIFIVQMTYMFIDLATYPTTLSSEEILMNEVEFPLVTVCNANKFRKSMLDGIDRTDPLFRLVMFEGYTTKGLYDIIQRTPGLVNLNLPVDDSYSENRKLYLRITFYYGNFL